MYFFLRFNLFADGSSAGLRSRSSPRKFRMHLERQRRGISTDRSMIHSYAKWSPNNPCENRPPYADVIHQPDSWFPFHSLPFIQLLER